MLNAYRDFLHTSGVEYSDIANSIEVQCGYIFILELKKSPVLFGRRFIGTLLVFQTNTMCMHVHIYNSTDTESDNQAN